MKYKITEKRKEFLRDKFFEYSFKNIDLDIEILNKITEPIELDYITRNHNYDDGNEILKHIIENPNCDFSTVKMIFFRSDIDSFLENDKDSEDYELINLIVNKYNKTIDNKPVEKFYYNYLEDIQVVNFDLELSKKIFPEVLFSKGKGKKLEPNFAESFKKRNINTLLENIEIKKEISRIKITTNKIDFEFKYPIQFEIVDYDIVENFVANFNFFQSNLQSFGVSKRQLKKAIINPESVIKSESFTIVFFVFNVQSLLFENALTNVANILRNEFIYIQAFLQIMMVEENFDKIKRIKHNENWFALSKGMKIKIENIQDEKYLKLLLVQKNDLLFYFLVVSNNIENLENETIQETVIKNINIKEI